MLSETGPDPLAKPPAGRERLAALIGRVADGDRDALAEVYRATSAKLYGLVVRILKEDEAEDVLQDVYTVVWRRAGAFDQSRGSAITWLAAIARNRAIDRLRSRRESGGGDLVERLLVEQADDGPLASELMERSQAYQRLAECLEELDPRHASAIRTAFYQGVTYETLAAGAGVPPGTMKSWVRRSLLRLRGCLER